MVFSFSSDFRHCLPFAVSARRNTLFLYAVASTKRWGFSSLRPARTSASAGALWLGMGIPLYNARTTASFEKHNKGHRRVAWS